MTRLVFQYFNCYSVHHRKFLKEDSSIECFPQVNDGNYDNDLWNNYLIYVIVIGVDGIRSDVVQESISPFLFNMSQNENTYFTRL